jgi:pyruvate kinase
MSHLNLNNLKKSIKLIKKNTKIPICIDTEGAQVRTKVKKEKFLRFGQKITITNTKSAINLYPEGVYKQIKINDVLNVGFNNLKLKVIRKKKDILCKVLSPGKLENNKGVHIENRQIKLNYLTKKDLEAIKIGKKFKIQNYALSFTNSIDDIIKFNNLLKGRNQIIKIETLKAIKNFNSILKKGSCFLIDRGDLSKEVKVENIPIVQRNLFKLKKKFKNKKIFVATNLLESMLKNNYPNRGEANDIYNSLEMGAEGLVLAAETAIGKYPKDAVIFLKKMIRVFKKNKY